MNYQTYEKLAHVGHKHYKDTNFCTVVAVATVTGMSFGKARIKMEKAGRVHRKGTIAYTYHQVVKRRGFDLDWIEGYAGHQVKTMGKKLGKGTFLVQIRGHIIAFVDGICNDWSDGRSFKVISVYKVTKSN